jgi:hypothetical protein
MGFQADAETDGGIASSLASKIGSDTVTRALDLCGTMGGEGRRHPIARGVAYIRWHAGGVAYIRWHAGGVAYIRWHAGGEARNQTRVPM